MLGKPFIALVSICVIAPGAQAARLTDVEGTVLLNTGEGFREVNGKTVVSAGDRVLVRGKGGARVDYGAGCITKIMANQTVVIAAEPTCKKAPAPTVSMKEAAPVKEVPAPPPFNDGLAEQRILIVGGLVVVGSAAAALGSKGDDKGRTPAPGPETPAPVVLPGMDGVTQTQAAPDTAAAGSLAAASAAVPPAASAALAPASGGDTANATPAADARLQPAAAHAAAAIAFNSGELADGSPVSP